MTDDERWLGPIRDTPEQRPVLGTQDRFAGRIWSVRTDTVAFDHQVVQRDVLTHLGAVAVLALDDREQVLLIRQYRHPVAMALFEPPAGLLDVAGEAAHRTAARELAEEAGYQARDWHVLVDLLNSPGGSSEAIRIYLARGLSRLAHGRPHTGEAEESHLPWAWVPLDQARDLVLNGQIGCVSAVAGILAAWAARQAGWGSLRPVDAPWPAREVIAASGRLQSPRSAR
ncbi:MAG: NUDIX hydrolase [Actinomycetales bacterium]|nr:NUDIX hydrolase [Actinomycetales bacterium]